MVHSHVYSLSAERVIHRGVKKCLVLVKPDQIVMQMNHRSTHKGQDIFTEGDYTTKLLNKVEGDFLFSASSEEEGDIRKPQSKDNVVWLSKNSRRRQEETEGQRNRRLGYHRQYNQGRRALETLEDKQFRLDLTRAQFNNETHGEREF